MPCSLSVMAVLLRTVNQSRRGWYITPTQDYLEAREVSKGKSMSMNSS